MQILVLFWSCPNIFHLNDVGIEGPFKSFSSPICILLQIFNNFVTFFIFRIFINYNFNVVNWIVFPQIFAELMERADEMVEILDCHILKDEFSRFLASPIIAYNWICNFLIIQEPSQKEYIKLIHKVLFLFFKLLVEIESMVSLRWYLKYLVEVGANIFFWILDWLYSDIEIYFFPLFL